MKTKDSSSIKVVVQRQDFLGACLGREGETKRQKAAVFFKRNFKGFFPLLGKEKQHMLPEC